MRFSYLMALFVVASPALCQSTRLGACDLSILGATESKSFLAFDRELRTAVSKQDPVALSFLVQFPLRINSQGGKYSLDDPAALQSRFEEVFPAGLRNAILNQKIEAIFCRDEGIMYGNGAIWVNPTKLGYAIQVVNLETAEHPGNKQNPRKIDFVCQTDKYRIVIDSDANRVPRYRTWNKPHSATGNPDLEMKNGDAGIEGTGVCAYPVWTFKNDATTYRMEGALGCFGDNEPPPPKAVTGRFEVLISEKSQISGWCY